MLLLLLLLLHFFHYISAKSFLYCVCVQFQGGCQRCSLNLSPSDKKRKRFDDASRLTPTENADIEHRSNEITEYENEDKLAHKSVAKSCCKIVRKECIHNSNSNKAPNALIPSTNSTEDRNKNYVKVRAKRGEATSRHSLAERIRRERISERMKFLEDLVPGCDKITGKAIMLDELINYVLSLQHQVELAAVDPRQKPGIDQFLLGDIHHSQGVTVENLAMGSFYFLQDNVSQVTLSTLAPSPNDFNKRRGASFLVSPKYNLVLRRRLLFSEVGLTSVNR